MKRLFWMLALAGASVHGFAALLAADHSPGSAAANRSPSQEEWFSLLEESTRTSPAVSASIAPRGGVLNPQLIAIREGEGEMSLQKAIDRYSRDAALEEYRQRSLTLADSSAEHIAMADWCRDHKLPDQEKAHVLRALEDQPDNVAWRSRVGHTRGPNGWETAQESSERRDQENRLRQGNIKWNSLLADQRQFILSGNRQQKEAAVELVHSIRDPYAVPSLEVVFGTDRRMAPYAIAALSKIEDPLATGALISFATGDASQYVKTKATVALRERASQAVPMLISALRAPVEAVTSISEEQGKMTYVQELARSNPDFSERVVARMNVDELPPGMNRQRDPASRVRAEDTRLMQTVRQENGRQRQINQRYMQLLASITGERKCSTPAHWWSWWQKETEVQQEGSPTTFLTQSNAPLRLRPGSTQFVSSSFRLDLDRGSLEQQTARVVTRFECFVAGTPVWTERGQLPIETIRTGDRVLTRNLVSGLLEFKPVVRPTVRPPEPLVSVSAGCDEFTCTGGHLFWVRDQGWIKARNLEYGSKVLGAQFPATVQVVKKRPAAITYNLVVAENHNYFVGQGGLLSHDNSPPQLLPVAAAQQNMRAE